MFVLFISPVFLAPIFNKYEPLEEGPLKKEILSMARANCIPAGNVYKFDASRQSNRISANVSGF
jgi:STE24 endopeptidase